MEEVWSTVVHVSAHCWVTASSRPNHYCRRALREHAWLMVNLQYFVLYKKNNVAPFSFAKRHALCTVHVYTETAWWQEHAWIAGRNIWNALEVNKLWWWHHNICDQSLSVSLQKSACTITGLCVCLTGTFVVEDCACDAIHLLCIRNAKNDATNIYEYFY